MIKGDFHPKIRNIICLLKFITFIIIIGNSLNIYLLIIFINKQGISKYIVRLIYFQVFHL